MITGKPLTEKPVAVSAGHISIRIGLQVTSLIGLVVPSRGFSEIRGGWNRLLIFFPL